MFIKIAILFMKTKIYLKIIKKFVKFEKLYKFLNINFFTFIKNNNPLNMASQNNLCNLMVEDADLKKLEDLDPFQT